MVGVSGDLVAALLSKSHICEAACGSRGLVSLAQIAQSASYVLICTGKHPHHTILHQTQSPKLKSDAAHSKDPTQSHLYVCMYLRGLETQKQSKKIWKDLKY